MPKPLREPPPSSSVARLFDLGAASRAVAATPDPLEVQRTRELHAPELRRGFDSARDRTALSALSVNSTGEPANIKRELVLSPATDEIFSRLVELYRRSTGSRLSASHVARAVLAGIAHCMPSLEREAREIGRLKLPSNARGREGERERFERRLAQALVAGIRAAAAYEAE